MDKNLDSTIDCVISGAGFAGLTCGLTLAERGFKVRILEKKADVGFKLRTTGIIVKDVVDQVALLDQLPDELTRDIPAVRLYSPAMRSIRLESEGYYFLATDTPGIMRWLADKAVKAGANISFCTPFSGATPVRGGWDLGQLGRARFLIGADGTHSQLARCLGLGQNTRLLHGIEHEYRFSPTGSGMDESDALHCYIDKKLAPGYIAWVLGGVNHVQAGLARRGTHHTVSLKQAMACFVERAAGQFPVLQGNPETIRAGPIPCGGLVAPLGTNRALLVGDAAGMVSPVTAGGIHTAIRYGLAAGHAVADFLEGRDPDPAARLIRRYPRFRTKRVLRFLFDHLQTDWMFDAMLSTSLMHQVARRLYFNH